MENKDIYNIIICNLLGNKQLYSFCMHLVPVKDIYILYLVHFKMLVVSLIQLACGLELKII